MSEIAFVMKTCTIRKAAILVGFLLVIKVAWNILSVSRDLPPLDVNDMPEQELLKGFKPRSCVMEDGVCKPFNQAREPVPVKGLISYDDNFYLDGRPFRILSGSFHYFRTQPAQWGDRLLRMRAAGLNTVTTYIPWNLHETVRKEYNFGGRWDLASFIHQVQKVGLKLIIRPGPYICSEWEFGGLPSWLLHDPDMTVRSSANKKYLHYVDEYFSKLLPFLSAFAYKKGGPIVAFQIENEFGSFGRDPDYIRFLLDQYEKWNIDELVFTSDGPRYLENGSFPGVLATVNFQKDPKKALTTLKKFQPNKPLMVTEFWSGWFDHWGESQHHTYATNNLLPTVKVILSMNASINFYMFVGGTNFEFWNGANFNKKFLPTITSYDYDAPISEWGSVTPKYRALRDLLHQYSDVPVDMPDIPPKPETAEYGIVHIKHTLTYADMIMLIQDKKLILSEPSLMESLNINNGGGQGYGWLLYRTIFDLPPNKTLKITGPIIDRAQIILNGRTVKTVDRNAHSTELKLIDLKRKENILDIFVENMGRVNYAKNQQQSQFRLLDKQRKGIHGNLYLGSRKLTPWQHIPFEFDLTFRQRLKMSQGWKPYEPHLKPTAYRGYFAIKDSPKDTFLNMDMWGKGIVLINGWNVGRYWKKGPQRTLYIPAPLLTQGTNEVIIFELEQSHYQVSLHKRPLLDPLDSKTSDEEIY